MSDNEISNFLQGVVFVIGAGIAATALAPVCPPASALIAKLAPMGFGEIGKNGFEILWK